MGKETQSEREPTHEEKRGSRDDPWLRCAACAHPIVREQSRIDAQGRHVHTFVNPAGHEYTIRCFADAPGCRGTGEESMFWTWFPGFAWRLALCAQCRAHVGWSFRSDTNGFWGLIADRLR